MNKIACIIYPHFSLYEIAPLTSTLSLAFGFEIDYIASSRTPIYSEDGLQCIPTKVLEEVQIDEYSCFILPGMIDFTSALLDDQLIQFLANLKGRGIKIAAISSAPILLARAGLLKDTHFTGGIWQNFFDYFEFLPRKNFCAVAVCEENDIITGTGPTVNAFSRQVLSSLKLTENADDYFREKDHFEESELTFVLPEQDFQDFKRKFEQAIQAKL